MATLSAFLNVHDIERTITAYEALGFKTERHEDDDGKVQYADLALEGAEISVGAIAADDDPEFQKWVSTPLGAGVMLFVSVPNVDAIHEKAVAAGWTVEQEPVDRPYGRVAYYNDPDGYVIGFSTD